MAGFAPATPSPGDAAAVLREREIGMAVQIQLRRDTAANWTAVDPTLAQGEIGIETDTSYAKMGDGATAWTALPYWPAAGAVLLLTTAARIALVPVDGTFVYDTDLSKLYLWVAPAWVEV